MPEQNNNNPNNLEDNLNENMDNNQESVDETGSYTARGSSRKKQKGNAAQKAAKAVAKGAANKVAPGAGGKAVDKLANTRLGQAALNKAGNVINNNPMLRNAAKIGNAMGAFGKDKQDQKNQNLNPQNKNNPPGSNQKKDQNNDSEKKDDENNENKNSNGGDSKLGKPDFLGLKGKSKGDGIDVMGKASVFIKKALPILIPGIGFIVIMLGFSMIILTSINGFSPLLGINTKTGGNTGGVEYIADSEAEDAFYERVKKLGEEYKNKGITIDVELIGSVFFILQNYGPKYDIELSMDDFDMAKLRVIAKSMFDKDSPHTCRDPEGNETTVNGGCPDGTEEVGFGGVYNKETFVENFKSDVIPAFIPGVSDEDKESAAEEIFEYIENYKDLIGEEDTSADLSDNNLYWWPVGSAETTEEGGVTFAKGAPSSTNITSYFAGRVHPITGVVGNHSGVDLTAIPSGSGQGNVIAALDGTVIYSSGNSCISGGSTSCGGGYGNYIVLQHADGNFTLYAHMHQGTVTVSVGDRVKQGQVVGKVGSTGMSTGAHLHFEVRVGANMHSNVVDPFDYVDPNNPRPVATGGAFSNNFITMLHSWEGTGSPPEGDNYVAYDDGTGHITVGYGIAVKYNMDRFAQFGIDGNTIGVGTRVPIAIVDQIEQMELQDNANSIKQTLAAEGINDLQQNQIEALISRMYNTGNIRGFAAAYKTHGNTQALYDNYMARPVTGVGVGYMAGLERRRNAEWSLFHTGQYVNNS